ncbi:hypothetical protein CEXT_596861 [Caerostris extrusa]|uniref:Uncharacterized protein n=1 Tax=Caerostris extrusa TaxID=172846 RepID=A0AAV4TCI3_CAEEX|nr:hypothetical protein CEXT_596861 [Caerostris extrusa]
MQFPPRSLGLIQGARRVQATDFQESDITPLGLGLDHLLEKASSKILCSPTPPLTLLESSEHSPCTLIIPRASTGGTRRVQATDFQESDIHATRFGIRPFLGESVLQNPLLSYTPNPFGIIRTFPVYPS